MNIFTRGLDKFIRSKAFKRSGFSKSNLAIFAIVFASIGGYLIYRSFAANVSLTIDGSQKFQTMSGFGVSINSHSWDNGNLKPALDMLIDQQGSQTFRVVMEMTDWESTNDDSNPSNYNWTYYNPIYSGATTYDTAQHGANFADLWNTIDYLHQKGIPDNQIILSFMGIGPSWMGGTTVNASMEDEWAEMVTSAAYYGYSHGHTFGIFSPDNEEDWGHNEGIIMSSTVYADAMNKVGQRLDALGMSNIRLLGPETASTTSGYTQAMGNIPSLMAKVDYIDAHNYSGNSDGFQALAQSYGKNAWMSEFSNFDDGLSFLGTGQNITGMMMWDAYDAIYNHAILNGLGSQPGNDQGNAPPLIAYNTSTKTYTPRQSFYQFAQLYKYVPIGSVRISDNSSLSGVNTLAFTHAASGRLTIVGENTTASSQTLSIALNNISKLPSTLSYYQTNSSSNFAKGTDVAVSGGTATVTVPANTVFTLTGTNVCDLNATTANFASQVSAASAGQTICLASGNYGAWSGTNKAITITSAPSAAVIMSLNFGTGDQDFTIDGTAGGGTMEIQGGSIAGAGTYTFQSNSPHNITIKNSAFTTTATVIDYVVDNGTWPFTVNFDHDSFNNISYNGGRIVLPYDNNEVDSGVIVQNSQLKDNEADGIESGAGITILNNEFNNIKEGAHQSYHTDSMQLFGRGAAHTIVKGNWIHNGADGIAIYDGIGNADIENNVISSDSSGRCLEVYYDNAGTGNDPSTVAHNTLYTAGDGKGCTIDLNTKAGIYPPGSGTIVKDNIAAGGVNLNNGSTAAVNTNNMCVSACGGTGNITSTASFVSSSPANHDDFLLKPTSPGHLAATDGTDIGISAIGNITYGPVSGGTTTPPPPPPPPTPPPPSDTTPPAISLTAPTNNASVSGSVTVNANASDNVGVVGVQFKLDGANLGSEDTASPYTITWNASTASNGNHVLTAVARDAAGNTTTSSSVNVTVTGGTSILLGDSNVEANGDSDSAGSVEAFKYTATGSGIAGTLSFYTASGTTATSVKVGIYADNGGHPGTLLTSGNFSTPASNGWNTATLSPSVNISTGTIYWIAVLGTGGALNFKDQASGACSESNSTGSLTTLPSTWTSGQSWPECNMSAYVSAGASAGPKTGDINGDNSVNITDLSLLLSSYGQNTTQCTTNTAFKCDLSSPGDNVVNIFDLSILLSNYGT